MPKARREIAPAPVDSTGKHARTPAAAASLALAVEYDRLRRELWRACGCVGLDDDPDLLAAARTADEGFRLSSRVPGVARELAAAKRARDAFVSANMGLARRFVERRCYQQGRDDGRPMALKAARADAEQAALADLLVGVDRFDPARGVAPSTWLVHWIARGARGEELRQPPARIPSRALTDWRRAEAVRARHYATTGEDLPWLRVCEILGAPPSHASVLEGVERALRTRVPADRHEEEGAPGWLVDERTPDDELDRREEAARALTLAEQIVGVGALARSSGSARVRRAAVAVLGELGSKCRGSDARPEATRGAEN